MKSTTFQRLYSVNAVCSIGSLALTILGIGGVITAFAIEDHSMDLARVFGFGGIGLTLLALPLGFAGAVLMCVLLYQAWKVIPEDDARTSPGLAVGLLFVPFFNLYWAFVAFGGLAVDLNRCLRDRKIYTTSASVSLGVVYPILAILSAIPYLGLLFAIPGVVVYLLYMRSVKNAAIASLATTETTKPQKESPKSVSAEHVVDTTVSV